MADDPDAVEVGIHVTGIPYEVNCPDNVTGSLETAILIPIISEPAR
ncbi:hypothetical protein GCM10027361_19060 [Erwinia aphidicola]